MKSILVLILLIFTLSSCLHNRWQRHLEHRHVEKENFALKVINNPKDIDKCLQDTNFTSKIFHNYYDYHKDEIIDQLEMAKSRCNGVFDINYSDLIEPLANNTYLVTICNLKNTEINFYWDFYEGKWDFSGINVDTLHLVEK